MVKRLVVTICIMCITSMLFAAGQKEQKPLDISFGGSYNYLSETSTVNNQKVFAQYNTVGVHLAMGSMLNEKWGMVNNIGVYFPYSITGETNGVKTNVDMSVYDFIFGTNILLGIPYYFRNDDSFSLGFGPAVDFLSLMYETSSAVGVGYYGGIGLVVDGKKQLNDTIFINFGTYGIYQFYQSSFITTKQTKESSSGLTNSLLIKPYLGLGFTINKPK